jgi:hypothetical protein
MVRGSLIKLRTMSRTTSLLSGLSSSDWIMPGCMHTRGREGGGVLQLGAARGELAGWLAGWLAGRQVSRQVTLHLLARN